MKDINIQCFLQSYTPDDCLICNPDPILLPVCKPVIKNLLQNSLERKYCTNKDFYNVKLVNDIIYNEPTHLVAVFKDFLILDDLSEFLKRQYTKEESVQRLPKVYEFYEKFSKVFPNYCVLPENKYMYKNIEKKQKIIDEK